VKVDDPSTVAAINTSHRTATAVHVNSSTVDTAVTLDLSAFRTVRSTATVTPVVTSASGALITGTPVRIKQDRATLTVPAQSVTTFLIRGVQGADPRAALIQDGHVYRIEGVASGRSITPDPAGAATVLRTSAPAGDQLWSFTRLTGGNTNQERYEVTSPDTGKRLAVRNNTLVLESPDTAAATSGSAVTPAPGPAVGPAAGPVAGSSAPAADAAAAAGVDAAGQWIPSTTGNGTWTLLNVGSGRLIDVTGQGTADGSPVGTYTPTSGDNQRWTLVDETVLGTAAVAAYTVPKLAPVLPATVSAVHRAGTPASASSAARGELPVVWRLPDERVWRKAGKVRVTGTATDSLGGRHRASAVVTVDTFVRTRPATATTYLGGRPQLPATVTGIGRHGGRAELPVVWGTGTYDQLGQVTVTGTATVAGGSTLPARATVTVVEPVEVNAAAGDGVTVSATYSESGYSAAGLRNGVRTEKAWSNWRSGTKNTTDTVTVALPAERDPTRVVTYFYRDGSNTSFPSTLRVQVLNVDGVWVDASQDVAVGTEGSPVIDVPLTVTGPVTAVRIVMTARPSGYITASEIEVLAKAVPE
ncbi:MAG TPA: RICIN domain-containing protein, partial [Actinoplanes sp.]|nr:RICIN domain-containing protein [Actinoplanes sp.]